MRPLSTDKLSFREIADFWSRESPASQVEILAGLEAAWWQGEITGNSAIPRLQCLKNMYRKRHELQLVVFVTPNDAGPPTETPLPDGGVVVDLTPRIPVPAEMDEWTEDSCNDAFEELARLPSRQFFPLLSYSIWFIELTPEEFFGWVIRRGFDVPKFWKRTAETGITQRSPQGSDTHDEQRSTFVVTTPAVERSPSEGQVKPKRLAVAKHEPEFKRWREQQPGGYLPTEKEDIAYMKKLGVSRDKVRELRKKFPTRERGQKKVGPIRGKIAG